ncbi:MAG: aminopeptidase P family protein [Bacteroidales bacterium]|nr:aminopeptidase P family protein [Bacteroidales bacterium]
MKEDILTRLSALRKWMHAHGCQAYYIPSCDPHGSEYVADYWQCRAWISGFEGSAGTLVVTHTAAALWTDSRYFLEAEAVLEGTGIALMRERVAGTPSVGEWLRAEGCTRLCADPRLYTTTHIADFAAEGITLATCTPLSKEPLDNGVVTPFTTLWLDRPALPQNPVVIHPLVYAGQSVSDKLACVRASYQQCGSQAMAITALDEIAWLLNLRGSDVPCNPVFMAYVLVQDTEAHLYTDSPLTSGAMAQMQAAGVQCHAYADFVHAGKLIGGQCCMPTSASVWVADCLAQGATTLCTKPSPITLLKAVKNEAEIAGLRAAQLRDGVAMAYFLHDLAERVAAGGETEWSVAERLAACRAAQPLYKGVSFETIAGYAANGAIVHYNATPQTAAQLLPRGFLLLDSGAQYEDGTTDITRTIPLGALTDEECLAYTLVLKGHIALTRARFPQGTCGTQLDLAARYALWQAGMNYGHGTGHGIGAALNVHEGPHQIRMNHVPTPLEPGMTTSNEPGHYAKGRFGVRIENVLVVVPYTTTDYGIFYQFDDLTRCPIDTTPLLLDHLTADERTWLNSYHALVRQDLLPLIESEAVRTWLLAATEAI